MLITLDNKQLRTVQHSLLMDFIVRMVSREDLVDEVGPLYESYKLIGNKGFFKTIAGNDSGQLGDIERNISILSDNEACLDLTANLCREINELLVEDGFGGSLTLSQQIVYYITDCIFGFYDQIEQLIHILHNGEGTIEDIPVLNKLVSLINKMGDDSILNNCNDLDYWNDEVEFIDTFLDYLSTFSVD